MNGRALMISGLILLGIFGWTLWWFQTRAFYHEIDAVTADLAPLTSFVPRGGNPAADDKDKAHSGMDPKPSINDPEGVCGDCHEEVVEEGKEEFVDLGAAHDEDVIVLQREPREFVDPSARRLIETGGRRTSLGDREIRDRLMFVMVDMGRPDRFHHLFLRFNFPISMLTWDVVVLNGYLLLNLHICGYLIYCAYCKRQPTKRFYIPFVFIAIVWAISIHTVTAFLYVGLGGWPFWNSAIIAPRFLASAFAAGPAFLIVSLWVLDRFTPKLK